jgi:F-type H+-transporting ATPase subunit epsilon
MAMTTHIDIVSAESEIFSGTAIMIFAPAEMGDVGIAARHAPMVTRLKPGEVRVETPEGETQHIYVSGGILEVQRAQAEFAEAAAQLKAIEAMRKRAKR